MPNSKISVIMPVYNTEKYLWEAIQSILDQTFMDFELIIIDDGSTDSSWNIIQEHSKKDKRIKAFQNKKNKRLVFTRNIALLKVSKGSQYVGICDADDVISPQWLQKTHKYMEESKDISAVGIDIQYMDANGNLWKEFHYPKTPKEKKKAIFRMSPMSHGGSLIRINDRKKVGFHYDESFLRAHDYELWSRFSWYWFQLAWIDGWVRTFHRVFGWTQGKRKYLKLTIKNSLRIQRRLYIKYRMRWGIKNMFYFIAECLLYLLPWSVVFWMFKKIRWIR